MRRSHSTLVVSRTCSSFLSGRFILVVGVVVCPFLRDCTRRMSVIDGEVFLRVKRAVYDVCQRRSGRDDIFFILQANLSKPSVDRVDMSMVLGNW